VEVVERNRHLGPYRDARVDHDDDGEFGRV
jgi:hypothetical protein